MGTITVGEVIGRCQVILQDAGAVRWTQAELIVWINDAQRDIAVLHPEASARVANLTLVAGTKQTMPANTLALIRMNRNMGAAGATPGEAPRRVAMNLMDLHRPGWHTDPATLVVKNWMYDDRVPRTYYVYPPMSGANQVEAEYSIPPATVTALGDTITLEDFYVSPITDFTLYRAFLNENDVPGMRAKADVHRAAYLQTLAGTQAGEEAAK